MAIGTIRALFLDVGGVLLTNGWGHESRQLAAKKFELDYNDLDKRHDLTFGTYEEGKLSLDEYLNRTVFHKPRTFSRDEFKSFMYSQSKPYPEMLELVRKLKSKHRLKVAVVSNEGRELTLHRVHAFRLNDFVDFFIFSCFVNTRKPDVDIWRLALDVAQIAADEVAYLDDREMFVEVAGTLGIQAIQHTDLDSTIAKLSALGLAP